MDYTGKTIWIIGASSGIGRALAYELDRRGAALLLSARRQNELDHLLSELKGPHRAFAVDVADLSGMMNAVEHAKTHLSQIDSIVQMAALYDPSPLSKMDIATTRKIVDVNLMGMFNMVHAVLPLLTKQGFGQLALCGSVAGYRGLPNGQPYSATKAAVINLAETLRLEHPELDVRLISPGFVRTPLTDKNDFDMPMMIEPDVAAKALADGLLASGFEIHFPKKFTFLLKLLRVLPNAVYFKLAKSFSKDQGS